MAALAEAERYIGMDYEWAGDDHWSTKGIDCSGLVVNAYAAATGDGEYWLPFDDASSYKMHSDHTDQIDDPEPGDLVFMGDSRVDHVAIFERFDGDDLWVIEATSFTGGVSRHSYPRDYHRLMGYGRLRLRTRECSGES